MGVRVKVTDSRGNGKANYKVHVRWHGSVSPSRGSTDSAGIFDTGTSGNAKDVEVFGEPKEFTQKDGVITIIIG